MKKQFVPIIYVVMLVACGSITIIPAPRPIPAFDSSNSGIAKSLSGEYLPLVKVAPIYPREAAQQGLEGWVIVEYTVNENGKPVDISVFDESPEAVFTETSIAAARQFVYKPLIVDGKIVKAQGVRNLFTYRLQR